MDEENDILSSSLKEKLAGLPRYPGIYQFKNAEEKIIYVGKAINLRNRVRSYFQQGRPVDAKTKALVKKITDVEVIVTDSEAEALILEDTLIKKFKPKYNIMLRDDKSYPYVRVTNELFPRVFATRKLIKDGSKYYGPFTEVGHLKRLLSVIRTIFQLRSCDLNITNEAIEKRKFKVCLDYHIKKCEGPCEGLVSVQRYNLNVKHAVQIVNGKTADIEKQMERDMVRLADELKFEEAAIVRNRYQLLKDYVSQQKIVSVELVDRDVIGIARVDDYACSLVFKVRDGKLIGKRHFIIADALEQTDEAIMQTTLEKWYLDNEFIPSEIFMQCEPEEPKFLLDWLKEKSGKSVIMAVPKLGDKKKIVNMAVINAEYALREYLLAITKREQTTARPVLSLQRDLRLNKPPLRIECFDNSHIQGSELVSSMVVFENGKPMKSDYRKFKIKTVPQNDDFAAMREVVSRRYTRVLDEKTQLPDLIVIDGGKGQLSSAVEVLKELKLENQIPIIGLAKRIDEIFFPGESESLVLPKTSSSLRIIQQLRDEAHRFAITYHRLLREKRTLKTELTNIPGIGEKAAEKLLIKFGSLENTKKATIEELNEVVNKKMSNSIIEYFKPEIG